MPIDGKEIRWWCHGCSADQVDDIWGHYNRATGEVLCDACKAAKYHGGSDNDTRSDIDRHHDCNKLQSNTSPDTPRVQE